MLAYCSVCGKTYKMRYTKGLDYLFPVCSEGCFEVYLRNLGQFNIFDVKDIEIDIFYNRHFRSPFEEIVFDALQKYTKVWFEPFILRCGRKEYVPDLYLPEKRIFIEVKGDKVFNYSKIVFFSRFVPIYLVTKSFGRLMGWI